MKNKEIPITFSGQMIRAILANKKTQTRRKVRGLPEGIDRVTEFEDTCLFTATMRTVTLQGRVVTVVEECQEKKWKYGVTGQRLWVREIWQPCKDALTGKVIPQYKADWEANGNPQGPAGGKWKTSWFMPRWASRITLEVTGYACERLQAITEADVIAEGCPEEVLYGTGWYRNLWDEINGAGSFESNPFVWVVSFKRIKSAT
jgi:hypothetical protein